jgi:hypothetical protein
MAPERLLAQCGCRTTNTPYVEMRLLEQTDCLCISLRISRVLKSGEFMAYDGVGANGGGHSGGAVTGVAMSTVLTV